MARRMPVDSHSRRRAALWACALVAALNLIGHANQSRSITGGVYTVPQAARGQQIYQTQCAECHNTTLEGSSGPPLVGAGFLANWSARPVADLVDKIQKTMPFGSPGNLSRQETTDLVAYILQAGEFPAGHTDLPDSALAQIVFPPAQSSPAPAVTAGATLLTPEGNLAELMRAIAFPNSNIIFNVQVKDPGAQPKKPQAAAPFDYVEWGST